MNNSKNDSDPASVTVLEITSVTAKSQEKPGFDARAQAFLQGAGFGGFKSLDAHGISARAPEDELRFLVSFDSEATSNAKLNIYRMKGNELVEVDSGNATSVTPIGTTSTTEIRCTCKILTWDLMCDVADEATLNQFVELGDSVEDIPPLEIDLPSVSSVEPKKALPRQARYIFRRTPERVSAPPELAQKPIPPIVPESPPPVKPPEEPPPEKAPVPEATPKQPIGAGPENRKETKMNGTKPKVSAKEIIELVAQAMGVKPKEITDLGNRDKVVAKARKIVFYILRMLFAFEVKDVVKVFGYSADPPVYVGSNEIAQNLTDPEVKRVIKLVTTAVEKGEPIPEKDRPKPAPEITSDEPTSTKRRILEVKPRATDARLRRSHTNGNGHANGSATTFAMSDDLEQFLTCFMAQGDVDPDRIAACLGVNVDKVYTTLGRKDFPGLTGMTGILDLITKVSTELDA